MDRRIERLARDVEYLESHHLLLETGRQILRLPQTPVEAEAAASGARRLMGVEDGPVLNLQGHCEKVGMPAFSLDLGPTGGDGAYVSVNRWGVSVVNGAIGPGRRRFNLAHELGHHLFDDAYAPEVVIGTGGETERIINAFAVHVLLPRLHVDRTWREFDDPRLAAVAIAVRFRVSWTAVCSQLKNLGHLDEDQRSQLAGDPPTAADFIELGERWSSELDPPSVPPEYGRRILAAYRGGKLTRARTVELLWGTVGESDLPGRHVVPLEGLRREFEPLA